MVTKRIRSEYMKKFKDPKWETYTKCYDELLRYRLTRRLLEHTHNPLFWSGSDSDSDSERTPPPPRKNQVGPETTGQQVEAEGEQCEGERTDRRHKQHTTLPETTVPRLKIPLPEEEGLSPQTSGVQGARLDHETRVAEEQRASSRGSKHLTSPQREREQETTDPGNSRQQQTKPSKSSKPTRRPPRVRPAPLRKPREENKAEKGHPFAQYGAGERHVDISGKKTYNVWAAASTAEIHDSALRAKTRREVEHQVQTQRAERRTGKSAGLDQRTQPEFNPWLTEYMRCFPAHS